jgi:hypothetical protein
MKGHIMNTTERLSDDTVIFESKLTAGELIELVNYMLDDNSVVLTYVTPELAKNIEAELSKAVLQAMHEVIDNYIN